jgi:putative ABC transport system ATP-binding protein
LVFQNFNLFPHFSVIKNVIDAPMTVQKKNREEAYEIGKQLLAKMGLADKEDAYPYQLSGGQQQRVSIGRSLINAPAVVLADEPTGNLDSKNSQEIVELLKLSNKKYNQTLIIVTHDENIALQAQRIIAIEDGKITRDEVIGR